MEEWIFAHWLDVLNATGVVGGLLFTAFSLREETKTRRVGNLLTLTHNHREVWSTLFRYPALYRVLDSRVAGCFSRSTREEELLVNLVIKHLWAVFDAMRDGLFVRPEGMRRDVAWFFSLPIPQAVWQKFAPLHDEDFVAFVEKCRGWK